MWPRGRRVREKAIAEEWQRKKLFFSLKNGVHLVAMLFVLSHRHLAGGGVCVKGMTSGRKAGRGTWEGFYFIFTKPCGGGIFKLVLRFIPSSSLFLYWNYWKMVGFYWKKRRGVCSWKESCWVVFVRLTHGPTRDVCTLVHTCRHIQCAWKPVCTKGSKGEFFGGD